MFGLGGQELIWVLLIVLVLFGGAKIPQLMKGMGEGMKEFRKATRDDEEDRKLGDGSSNTRV
ncbi:MAG: sec-independent protein translocase protein TatA [Abditibacteriota bacterium]|nr:sec-independent protein translocase protein TatA [Abditibacteriota bacterium]